LAGVGERRRARRAADAEPFQVRLDPQPAPPVREPLLGERLREGVVVDVAEPLEIGDDGVAHLARRHPLEPLPQPRPRQRPARKLAPGQRQRPVAVRARRPAIAVPRAHRVSTGAAPLVVGSTTSPAAAPGGGTLAPGITSPSYSAWIRLRIAVCVSGCSRRNAFTRSRPWPRRSSPKLKNEPLLVMILRSRATSMMVPSQEMPSP